MRPAAVEAFGRDGQGLLIPGDEICESAGDIRTTLHRDISFEDSCVDMAWKWEVQEIYGPDGNLEPAIGYRLRTSFQRPDRDTGKIGPGWGRWHEVPLEPTVSSLVKTAFVACKMILEHELMEAMKWKGKRPFDPHNTVQELVSLNTRTTT
jgi:hypothetical protein